MEGGGYYPKILPKPHTDGVMPVPDGGNNTWAGKVAITSSESKASGKLVMPKSSASEHDSKSSGKSAAAAAAADAKSSTNKRNEDNEEEEGQELREQDRFMPIANVIRIMRKVLPTHAKISDDAKETIQECVSEYISFITSEANDRCQREQRKTITAEDVLWAMNKLGFDDYVEPLSMYLQRYREVEGEHRGSIRGEPLPMSLKRSRQDMSFYGPPPSYHMGHFHHQQHQHHQHHPVMYGGGMAGYYREGGGSSSSPHLPIPGFDPSYPFYNK